MSPHSRCVFGFRYGVYIFFNFFCKGRSKLSLKCFSFFMVLVLPLTFLCWGFFNKKYLNYFLGNRKIFPNIAS